MSLLAVKDLTVEYAAGAGRVVAVDGVSFEVGEGEIVSLVGESGCGKSATAMAVVGLLDRNAIVSGQVVIGGRVVGSDLRSSEVRGKEVAYIFQEPATSLNPVMPVGAQITEMLRRHTALSRSERRARAVELLDTVGIPSPAARVKAYPHELSGGMRQRVMIAIAIACRPRLLIADEPTTALDVTVQAGILDLLREMRAELGMAVLLITHNLGVVADIADRVIVMYAGRFVEDATVHELFANPRHPYTQALLGAIPQHGGHRPDGSLLEIPGTVPALRAAADYCAFAPRCSHRFEPCERTRPLLSPVADGHVAACHLLARGAESA